jgi:hypothetical protein
MINKIREISNYVPTKVLIPASGILLMVALIGSYTGISLKNYQNASLAQQTRSYRVQAEENLRQRNTVTAELSEEMRSNDRLNDDITTLCNSGVERINFRNKTLQQTIRETCASYTAAD